MGLFKTRDRDTEASSAPSDTEAASSAQAFVTHEEFRALREEVSALRAERDALKDALGIFMVHSEKAQDRAGFRDGSVSYRLSAVVRSAEGFGVSPETCSVLQDILKRCEVASRASQSFEFRNARTAPRLY